MESALMTHTLDNKTDDTDIDVLMCKYKIDSMTAVDQMTHIKYKTPGVTLLCTLQYQA